MLSKDKLWLVPAGFLDGFTEGIKVGRSVGLILSFLVGCTSYKIK